MNLIDFNYNFQAFKEKEDVLLDTGIILGLLNEKSKWHNTIRNLFDTHIFNNDNTIFLYVNPTVLNEVTFLKERPIQEYVRKHPEENITETEVIQSANAMIEDVKSLIEQGILLILDGNKDTALTQLSIYEQIGSADAVNASLINGYGISFLTTDGTLANKLKTMELELPNIQNIYYTTSKHLTY